MARGWESKSVEQQIESSEGDRRTAPPKRLSPAEVALHWKKDSLLLSKSRVLQQLQGEVSPRYREMLNGALADLEKQLAQFDEGGAHA